MGGADREKEENESAEGIFDADIMDLWGIKLVRNVKKKPQKIWLSNATKRNQVRIPQKAQ